MDVRRFTRVSVEKSAALISEVRKFPALYDVSDPNHYILGERNKAWIQVASNFNEPVDQCHLRWKALRKRYAKERRKIHEVLQGQRKPWALFPKMAFLAAALSKPRPISQRKKREAKKQIPFDGPDDDMLILDANDEVVRTCKSIDSEEDEYIYETLDDPDTALEIMNQNPVPNSKPMAIRSGGSGSLTARVKSGRIRKITPKMQNSIIAKKLKQAQEIIQQANDTNGISPKNTPLNIEDIKPKNIQKKYFPSLKQESTESKQLEKKQSSPKEVLSLDNNNRHVATITPSFVRVESLNNKSQEPQTTKDQSTSPITYNAESESNSSEANLPFKIIRTITGRNPVIFSPDQLPDIQNFLKSEAASNSKAQTEPKPAIKVKSVDNLNQQMSTDPNKNGVEESINNLDIIHSVGLMRKDSPKSSGTNKVPSGRRLCPSIWAELLPKSRTAKNTKKLRVTNQPAENIQSDPESQTKDYEIEETWNDIKQEPPEPYDDSTWRKSPTPENNRTFEESSSQRLQVEPLVQGSMLHKVNEAKLELISFQRSLLEEQHRRSMEYMKKEHDLKMTLLKAEIDLKRKQLNIML